MMAKNRANIEGSNLHRNSSDGGDEGPRCSQCPRAPPSRKTASTGAEMWTVMVGVSVLGSVTSWVTPFLVGSVSALTVSMRKIVVRLLLFVAMLSTRIGRFVNGKLCRVGRVA